MPPYRRCRCVSGNGFRFSAVSGCQISFQNDASGVCLSGSARSSSGLRSRRAESAAPKAPHTQKAAGKQSRLHASSYPFSMPVCRKKKRKSRSPLLSLCICRHHPAAARLSHHPVLWFMLAWRTGNVNLFFIFPVQHRPQAKKHAVKVDNHRFGGLYF